MNQQLEDAIIDAYLAVRRLFILFDRWARTPVSGVILINGVRAMTTADTTPTDIPDNDVPAKVQWADRLGDQIPGTSTQTTWSAEDETGAASQAVTVEASADDDESATVHFTQGTGQFKVVATTAGQGGAQVRAESGMYNIVPGAPAQGQITLNPV